jgi:histidinol dehydrogenase
MAAEAGQTVNSDSAPERTEKLETGPVENHRGREKGAIVYPVFSRRSKGLSIGINLFPGRKVCPFNCIYCEVFPFNTEIEFSAEIMEAALIERIGQARDSKTLIKDICFSGNGEPTASPHFARALRLASELRDTHAPEAALVLISSGAGLLDGGVFSLLREYAAGPAALNIWLKIDAGTEAWYKKLNRSAIPHGLLIARIREFAALAPVTVQTMLCTAEGLSPPAGEAAAWERLVTEIAVTGRAAAAPEHPAGLRGVQIYGKARPSPEDPKAERVPEMYLAERAESLRRSLARAGIEGVPVDVFP